MTDSLHIQKFLTQSDGQTVVDVRTPSEFQKGHIPGAVNIPLFSDDERVKVGTLYKQEGQRQAILEGLASVGQRLRPLAEAGEEAAREKQVFLYCWRGGMRSSSLSWLWELLGLKTTKLRRGYKAYRNYIYTLFERPLKIQILGGKTGSRKTDILKELQKMGEQVIDLEALACHKGSAFGALGEKKAPTQEHFENLLGWEVKKLDTNRRVWVEDESRFIGRLMSPEKFWEQMENAPVSYIECPRQERVNYLVEIYGNQDIGGLADSIDKIKKKLGGARHKEMQELLQRGDLSRVCELSLDYYDSAYEYGLTKRKPVPIDKISVEKLNIPEIATLLIKEKE